jgi:hypothetical protein
MTLVGTNWVVTTVAGHVGVTGSADGLGTNALFNYAQSAAFGSAGNIYVADTHNSTIRIGHVMIPSLQIGPSAGNEVIVSWPNWAAAYVLETSNAIPAGSGWTPLTNGVAVVGNNFVLTNNATATAAFYRLHGQ